MVDRLFSDTDLAALYDAWWPRDQRKDFDFYLPLVMSAEAVLDAGCGTGAMLHEARQSGHKGRLCGLDPAAGMLAQARKRRDIERVLGDLASIAWAHEFDLVVMTGHAFQALVEDDELRKSLARIRLALTNNSRFTFETRNPLQPRLSRSTLRFLDADLLSSFLAGAGLVIEEQFGDWDRQPLTDTSPEIINIARPR